MQDRTTQPPTPTPVPRPIERSTDNGDALLQRRAVRVVVAEDDDDMRNLIASGLRRDGMRVTEARDGTELLELMAAQLLGSSSRQPFDLVVSDVRMPGYNGLGALSALRHAGLWMPVILITAFGDEDTHAEAHRLGAVAVFDKPFDVAALRLLARAIVD